MSADSMHSTEKSFLKSINNFISVPLSQLDAFPKIPSAFKARSGSRGFMTILISIFGLLLILNDISEFIWGWPDQEFSIDSNKETYLNINIDITVNMPCQFLSVDLRDAVGDRLLLSSAVSRTGVVFDASQATQFSAHSRSLSVKEVYSQSRKSRGVFAFLRRPKSSSSLPMKRTHSAADSACRIHGSLSVKRVTANLHITTLGHGYSSYEHVPHDRMNLSHIIEEFSFGPFFPDITQPLDYSAELANDPFIAYQYFLHVVPTTYIPPRNKPLHTNQYSVTHYKRVLEHNQGAPGIFFKFDLDPMRLTIYQRTSSFTQLLIRCVGVFGGIFVCTSYALRVTARAIEIASGSDSSNGIVAAEATGANLRRGLSSKWLGSELRSRTGGTSKEYFGHASDGYSSYAGTPVVNGYPSPIYSNRSPSTTPLPVTDHSHGSLFPSTPLGNSRGNSSTSSLLLPGPYAPAEATNES